MIRLNLTLVAGIRSSCILRLQRSTTIVLEEVDPPCAKRDVERVVLNASPEDPWAISEKNCGICSLYSGFILAAVSANSVAASVCPVSLAKTAQRHCRSAASRAPGLMNDLETTNISLWRELLPRDPCDSIRKFHREAFIRSAHYACIFRAGAICECT